LLREWFDLMKERTELRRYEKELLVRAQEVQLEDRHERLQQELRNRLADDGKYCFSIQFIRTAVKRPRKIIKGSNISYFNFGKDDDFLAKLQYFGNI